MRAKQAAHVTIVMLQGNKSAKWLRECLQVRKSIVRAVVIPLSLVWAMRASVPFVAGSVGDKRRYLAVFPLALMYTVLGWLTFIC